LYIILCVAILLALANKKNTTILLRKETRSLLSKIGRKEQTYDQLIRELVLSKNKLDKLEDKNSNLHHSNLSINS